MGILVYGCDDRLTHAYVHGYYKYLLDGEIDGKDVGCEVGDVGIHVGSDEGTAIKRNNVCKQYGI